jgi:hypothetical protein
MLVSAAGLDPAQDAIKKLRDAIHYVSNLLLLVKLMLIILITDSQLIN